MHEAKKLVEQAVATAFNENVDVALTRPDSQFGDFATNVALQLGKKLGKNPREVADTIIQVLPKDSLIAEASVAGPGFINLTLKSSELAKCVVATVQNAPKSGFGSTDVGSGKTVICEFPSPNMAKPYSVGHIRSAIQGWAVYKLMNHMGYKTIRDNHLGDYGTPFGKWVAGFLKYSNDAQLEKDGIYELGRIYIAITKDLKAEKEAGKTELADEVQSWLTRLEQGDPEAKQFSQRFNKISLDHMHDVMRRLGVETDEELGESFYVERGQQLVDELLQKGIAVESEGAVIVDLEDQGIDIPIVLRKANGAALYATTDLATMEYRQKTWKPTKTFIHVGQEQSFYFDQLKALARKIGFEDTIIHMKHGMIDVINDDGQREKMSSRKGVILLEELLDKAEEKAKSLTKDGSDVDAKAVALGAIKFNDFKADRKTGILFDWDTMFNVHGFSGPAVQYSAVRIKSILRKATADNVPDNYDWQSEHNLLLLIGAYPDLLSELAENYEMHKLAHYLYSLTQEFNRYYEKTPVLKAEEPARSARLWLIAQVAGVLESGLDILGIPTPEKM